MPIDWDPDYIADEFVAIMLTNWTRDDMAYMHITIMTEE